MGLLRVWVFSAGALLVLVGTPVVWAGAGSWLSVGGLGVWLVVMSRLRREREGQSGKKERPKGRRTVDREDIRRLAVGRVPAG